MTPIAGNPLAAQLLRGMGLRALVGVDLVEVNPCLDHSVLMAHVAAPLLLEAVATANLGGGLPAIAGEGYNPALPKVRP